MSSSRTAAILWLLLTLFALRVVAQALVGLSAPPFLPAWNQSGIRASCHILGCWQVSF